jgi:hypothetical protein
VSLPLQPGGGARTGPMLEQAAQDAIAAARAQPRQLRPPEGYEAFPLSPAEKAEADKAGAQHDPVCGLCGGYHYAPSTAACPRLASFELDGDGKLKSGTFWPGGKWAKGRVVFKADALEEDEPGGE